MKKLKYSLFTLAALTCFAFNAPAQKDDQKKPPKNPPVIDPVKKPPRENPPKGGNGPKKPGMYAILLPVELRSDELI